MSGGELGDAEGQPNRFKPHHLLIGGGFVVGTGAFVATVVSYSQTHSGLALWLLACLGVGAVLNVVFVVMSRRAVVRASDPTALVAPRLTGRVIPVRDPNRWSASPTNDGGWRWIGGASIPFWLGRLNASTPLAWLELGPNGLAFGVRLGRLFGIEPLALTVSDAPRCYPVRGFLRSGGVAIQPEGTRPWYFWTGAVSEILSTLAWAGFQVTWEEQKPRWW